MEFRKGDRIGEMHGHQPSQRHSALTAFNYQTVSIIEIDDEAAATIAVGMGLTADALKRDGKQAYAVASNETQVVTLYFYDTSFFLTTLVTATPEG